MVRFSDIFKKSGGSAQHHPSETKPNEEPLKEKSSLGPKPQAPHSPLDTLSYKAMARKDQAETGEFKQERVAKAINETVVDIARSKDLYLMGIQLIKEISINIEQLKPINLIQIEQWVNDLTDCLISVDTELLHFFYVYTSEKYLYEHVVNTAIMSVEVGLGLGYNKSQLNELGLAAFLHDIGMIKVEELGMQPRKLNEEEYIKIKDHPLYGVDILSKIKDISEPVIYVAKEEHERVDGSGYPNGLKNGEISEYGRIVAIMDVYEALTHNRPYNKKFSPHEAIKELITNGSKFDPLILKVMIKRVGIYPINSWVELNSNEIGKVMRNNDEFPLRPVLQILFDAKGAHLKEPHSVDLSKQFNLFIKRSINEEELARETENPE
jgi:HD-GYP domain-containing protein (c-di-GMP phosphodiesterase class II)